MLRQFDVGNVLSELAAALAVVSILFGIAVAADKLSTPAVLRRRQSWLLEALTYEENEYRRSALEERLHHTTARLIAGLAIPIRYYLDLLFFLAFAPIQVILWQDGSDGWWNLLFPLLVAIILISTPMRRVIRLTAERLRLQHEYIQGDHVISKPRTDILALMEGGSLREHAYGLLVALFVVLLTLGIALGVAGYIVLAVVVCVVGAVGCVISVVIIRKYVEGRVDIAGPYPNDHAID